MPTYDFSKMTDRVAFAENGHPEVRGKIEVVAPS